jgi:hypothetical protein
MTDEQIEATRAAVAERFGRCGVVRYEGRVFFFQQPNTEHGRFWRRLPADADPAPVDQLASQLIVGVDETVCLDSGAARAPVREALTAFLKTRPLALDCPNFGYVLNELLGLAEAGTAEKAGKGCSVSSNILAT